MFFIFITKQQPTPQKNLKDLKDFYFFFNTTPPLAYNKQTKGHSHTHTHTHTHTQIGIPQLEVQNEKK
jgi:hypothetical protein